MGRAWSARFQIGGRPLRRLLDRMGRVGALGLVALVVLAMFAATPTAHAHGHEAGAAHDHGQHVDGAAQAVVAEDHGKGGVEPHCDACLACHAHCHFTGVLVAAPGGPALAPVAAPLPAKAALPRGLAPPPGLRPPLAA